MLGPIARDFVFGALAIGIIFLTAWSAKLFL